ncbi:hypothetical protein Cob_v002153 [Colletotrichum orbiculare MAFF 240422]|uniref:Uncharacterized protein n=1 Tax=Colletotrichum orbiculare (strain 104-T / ATCC 96160 / CBS 514.97 / LARS 414 / MAFF 240422) TaxID=1213857 RepID=N4VHM8_COLOR|nr:hypothetical protein Cob_v002153 [Colletotrichum orbiculare MAFF 240422]
MRFFILCSRLLVLAVAAQAQNPLAPRGFKFVGRKKGVAGGCDAEDVAVILKELETAEKAAEFAAQHLTEYPYFWAFQAPDHPFFQGKDFERAARDLYARMAQVADGFHTEKRFRIECRSDLCLMSGDDTIAATQESMVRMVLPPQLWLKRPDDPVMAFCGPFFKPSTWLSTLSVESTEKRLQQFRKVLHDNPDAEDLDTKDTILNMRSVGNTRSQIILHELAHTAYVSKPIMEILKPNAMTESITLDHAYEANSCFWTAQGVFDRKTRKVPDPLAGAKLAAENAESWGLVAMGIYMSSQLQIQQIPIPGVPNYAWAHTDKVKKPI